MQTETPTNLPPDVQRYLDGLARTLSQVQQQAAKPGLGMAAAELERFTRNIEKMAAAARDAARVSTGNKGGIPPAVVAGLGAAVAGLNRIPGAIDRMARQMERVAGGVVRQASAGIAGSSMASLTAAQNASGRAREAFRAMRRTSAAAREDLAEANFGKRRWALAAANETAWDRAGELRQGIGRVPKQTSFNPQAVGSYGNADMAALMERINRQRQTIVKALEAQLSARQGSRLLASDEGQQMEAAGLREGYVAQRDKIAEKLAMRGIRRQSFGTSEYSDMAQGNIADQIDKQKTSLAEQTALAKERLKYLAGPQAKKALEEEARGRRELVKLQGAEQYRRMALEQGQVAAGATWLAGKLGTVQEKMGEIGRIGMVMSSTLVGGMLSLASAADPFSTFPTFTESLKALSIEVGAMFLPVVDEMSGKLQDAAKWFRGLDEGTKETIGSVVKWTAIIGAGTFALTKLVGALRMVAVTIAATGRLLMVGSPWIAGIAAAGVAAYGLYRVWKGIRGEVEGSADASGRMRGGSGGEPKKVDPRATALANLPRQWMRDKVASMGGDAEKIAEFVKLQRDTVDETIKKLSVRLNQQMIPARAEDDKFKAFLSPGMYAQFQKARERRAALTGINGAPQRSEAGAELFIGKDNEWRERLPSTVNRAGRFLMEEVPGFAKLSREMRIEAAKRFHDYTISPWDDVGRATQKRQRAVEDSPLGRELAAARERREKYAKALEIPGVKEASQQTIERAYRNLPPARILDPEALGNAIQIRALTDGGLAEKNTQRQLELAGMLNEKMAESLKTLQAIQRGIERGGVFPWQ